MKIRQCFRELQLKTSGMFFETASFYARHNAKRCLSHALAYLEGTTTAALHQIADVSCLNACSNEWLYVVMVQLLQLQIKRHQNVALKCTSDIIPYKKIDQPRIK